MHTSRPEAENRLVLVTDLEDFAARYRSSRDRLSLIQGLYDVLRQAFDVAGLPWEDSYVEDRGDGALIVLPAGTRPDVLVNVVPEALTAALTRYNAVHPPEQRIDLTIALHGGQVAIDEAGVHGAVVSEAFRLLDAPRLEGVTRATVSNAPILVFSEWLYDDVVRRSKAVDPAGFRPVTVHGKEHTSRGWIRVPRQVASDDAVPRTDLPVTIYLTNERVHEQVETAVTDLLARAGAEIIDKDEPVLGSWFRRLWVKGSTSPTARDAAVSAAHALDARLVLSQDATITATMMQNLGPVLTALQPTPDAVLRIGALLIVKADNVVAVHQLTAAQQLTLDHQPHLLTSPHDILRALNLTGQDRQATGTTPSARALHDRPNIDQISAAPHSGASAEPPTPTS
ncbi:hypothetical protein DMH01_15090 [Amycolatopsis sp. WAC 04182]|uniref:hypothetical protein n=1 Tax=Amycolatopsis sp. WAC 04182 TaxID=2203198 RepID=UPI000F7B787E|nr:hypothetical protein [Amycolatopsis sp. WAC 04182]RSN60622.1 hypothetical protein DMH01_15090 [Amycolatopsis sp. WAC 04182]